ncbi:MAG: hypothetical protein JRG82_06205 [Deltaproteobacteria bacterium]|nr:hypothetical protein [Deltaproteobacteria bacterium]
MDEFESQLEALQEQSERVRLRAWLAGDVEDAALLELDERFEDVTSGDALDRLRSELDGARLQDEREARLRRLGTAESAVLAARLRRLGAELRARESRQEIVLGGSPVAVVEVAARMALEDDAGRRAELRDELDRAAGDLDELREERFARAGEVRARLGYADGLARAAALHPQLDFDAWRDAAEVFLAESEPAWLDALTAASRRIGVRGAPALADLPRVLRADVLDSALPVARLVGCLDHAFNHFGAGLAAACAVEFCRPDASGDARSFALRPPDQVVWAACGAGGVGGAWRAFGAAGSALAAAFCAESLPEGRRRAFDPALPLAWERLFENVWSAPEWLEESPLQLRAAEASEAFRLRRLLTLRSVCAQVVFERALADLPGGSDPHALAEAWAEVRERATHCRHATAGYLRAADPELASVHELRAQCFGAQLGERLRQRHGKRFWHERGAAELLKEVWNTGGTYRLETLASELELGPLDVAPLLEDALR